MVQKTEAALSQYQVPSLYCGMNNFQPHIFKSGEEGLGKMNACGDFKSSCRRYSPGDLPCFLSKKILSKRKYVDLFKVLRTHLLKNVIQET